jgi:glutathione synthase|tara:strand:+ start:1170 stop:2111 length:942 start_codon:yes stop_codon:yes gene_type:complete
MMTPRVAFQMDHISSLNIEGDTTFALCLEAQNRNYKIFHYTPEVLTYENGIIRAPLESLEVNDDKKDHYALGPVKYSDFSDIDVLLMRQEPPFNMNYITYTHLLEHLPDSLKIINNPASVRNAPEKLLVTFFKDLMPETIITRDKDAILNFQEKHNDIVVKPLFGKGGEGIILIKKEDDVSTIISDFLDNELEPIMVQPFLPEVKFGDKRIIILNGEPVGCLNRIPADGEFRSNLGVGGIPVLSELSDNDIKICERIKSTLLDMNLFFVGIDVIGDYLTEINVTCPTGVRQIKGLGGPDIPNLFWRQVEDLFF